MANPLLELRCRSVVLCICTCPISSSKVEYLHGCSGWLQYQCVHHVDSETEYPSFLLFLLLLLLLLLIIIISLSFFLSLSLSFFLSLSSEWLGKWIFFCCSHTHILPYLRIYAYIFTCLQTLCGSLFNVTTYTSNLPASGVISITSQVSSFLKVNTRL